VNMYIAARLHFLPMLSRYSRMSKTVQQTSSARRSTTGEVFAWQAVLVAPRWRVKSLSKHCDSFCCCLPQQEEKKILMQTHCSFKSVIEKSTKTMTEAQEKNHTDPIHLSSRTLLGQLMRRAVTYTHQAGADGINTSLPSKKKISLFLGPPSYKEHTASSFM